MTSVERQKSLQWSKWGYEATAMGVWSIVHVRLQNTGNRNGMPYPYDVQLMDESGTMYDVNRRVSFLYSDYHQLYTFTETVPPGVWIEAGSNHRHRVMRRDRERPSAHRRRPNDHLPKLLQHGGRHQGVQGREGQLRIAVR